jgi:hypothetical protein
LSHCFHLNDNSRITQLQEIKLRLHACKLKRKVINLIQLLPQYVPSPNLNKCMADQMDQELQRNLLHVFKIPEVFIPSIFLACSLADPSLTTAVTGVSLGVYLKTLSCLLNGPSLAHYCGHRCLALCSFTRNRCRLPPAAIASLQLRSLSACDLSPPPAYALLSLQAMLLFNCDRCPFPAAPAIRVAAASIDLDSWPTGTPVTAGPKQENSRTSMPLLFILVSRRLRSLKSSPDLRP